MFNYMNFSDDKEIDLLRKNTLNSLYEKLRTNQKYLTKHIIKSKKIPNDIYKKIVKNYKVDFKLKDNYLLLFLIMFFLLEKNYNTEVNV